MLPLPDLRLLRPSSTVEALRMFDDEPTALFVAGGTDLVPNIKYGLYTPAALIDLTTLGLRGIARNPDGEVRIGACTTLYDLETSSVIADTHPALASAASTIAAPQHRRMGTVGGNVLIDTRCLWYNAPQTWREALGGCLKKDGVYCRVTGGPRRCVAARCGDTVPVLLALDASIVYETSTGIHSMPIRDLFGDDGRVGQHLRLPVGTLVREIVIPSRSNGLRTAHRKVAIRQAIDFPLLSLAVSAQFAHDVCEEMTVVVSAVWPKPRVITFCPKARLTEEWIAQIAQTAFAAAHPLPTALGPGIAWRRQMARVETERALRELVATSI